MKRADDTATYVYCLVHGRTAPSLARVPRGLPGTGAPRLLDAGDGLRLVVADAPLARCGAEPIERGLRDLEWVSTRAMAHEAVVEHVARAGTVIPMKLFTLFGSDERAVAHVRRSRKKLDRLIARVADRDEWGVRLHLDETRARRGIAARAGRRADGGGRGTGFLLRKKEERDALRALVERARAEGDRVYEQLAKRADDGRRHTPAQGATGMRVLLDAAFLVPAPRAADFRAAVKALGARLVADGFTLTLTGPWPPYTFVTEPA